MKTNDVDNLQFKGFIVNIVQANWNVIQSMFGPSGDPSQPLQNKEIACIFH